jgi:ectoine hydroxylase-related dioxygenase (phytanoyl-CoA dioxygenase family)
MNEPMQEAFQRDGYVLVRGVLGAGELGTLRERAEAIVRGRGSEQVGSAQVQAQYDRQGCVELMKVNQLTETDPLFVALASRPAIVDVVERLMGGQARLFRDVLVMKPARSQARFSYHQDSAYWDVEPPALISCWLALTDVPENASCLRVIPGSHDRRRAHGLMVAGRTLPGAVAALLRQAVSYAGTGDNPGRAGGYRPLWAAKRYLLGEATRFLPVLSGLQDFRALPAEIEAAREVALPVQAGDAVFFHSLLLHASGPNDSDRARFAPIISYMPAQARFVGKGKGTFRLAREQVAR